MPKYIVIQGSVALPPADVAGLSEPRVASIGESLELTDKQAEGLIATGFIADEKTFAGLKKMVEGAAESGALLPRHLQKLATGLATHKAKQPSKGK